MLKKKKTQQVFDYNIFHHKKSKKKFIIISSVCLTIIVAIVLSVFFLFFTSPMNNGTGGTAPQSFSSRETSTIEYADGEKIYEKKSSILPVRFDEWEIQPFTQLDDSSLPAKKLSQNIFNITTDLPRESAGFTSDKEQAFDSQGGMNPLYSYWTDESFKKETGIIIERFLNPIFGDWVKYQKSDHPDNGQLVNLFSDIYTERWKESEGNNPRQYLPIFADWDNNDYGMGDFLAPSVRWVGSIDRGEIITTYDENNQQYSASVTAYITFTSYTQDEKTVVKHGVLHLQLVDNSKNINSEKTVLVDSSSLEVSD